MSSPYAPWIVLIASAFIAPQRNSASSDRVQLTIATLHAAALTTPRSAGDSTDAPFFVVEVIGSQASSASILPENGQGAIRLDGALGARPLTGLSLAAGDSVQVLVSVLESVKRQVLEPASGRSTHAASASAQVEQATRLVAPLVKDGAHWLGSVSLLLTNEGGSIHWRRLDCVATCKVLTAPSAAALPTGQAQAFAGVVEFSGKGGTYHLALRASREQ